MLSPRTIAALTVAVMTGVLVGSCTVPEHATDGASSGPNSGTGSVKRVATPHIEATPAQESALLPPRTGPGLAPSLALSASPTPRMTSPTMFGTESSPAASPVATPTYAVILIPTSTPDRTFPTSGPTVTPTALATRFDVPSLDSFQARGSFTTRTQFANGRVTEQSGHFAVARKASAGPYRTDEFYRLTTVRDGGNPDTISVYQIGDQIAVDYGESDWVVTLRSQGSPVVKAIQPVVDLSTAFLSRLDQAEKVGEEIADNRVVTHYQITDIDLFASLFSQWLPGLVETLVSVQFDGWLVDGDSYLVKYEFQAELANTPALDSESNPVTADQSLHWTYEVTDAASDLVIAWPEDAPKPGSVQVPGFKAGTFPIPPDAEVINNYVGLPELISQMGESELLHFYEERLDALGWSIEGDYGLYTLRDGVHSLILIIEEDPTLERTRINIFAEN